MVSALGSLASPTSRCHRQKGGAGGAARGIPPAAPLTRGYPGPSPTRTDARASGFRRPGC